MVYKISNLMVTRGLKSVLPKKPMVYRTNNLMLTRWLRSILPKQPKKYKPWDIASWHKRNNHLISTYTNKSAVRSLCGAVCVSVGIITLPIPTGSIFLILFGAGLLGYDIKALYNRIKYEINLFKVRYL